MRPGYVLLTAAKNEEAYIGEAIRSVLRQSVLPSAWFIMNDGSIDRTGTIVANYMAQHPFIRHYSEGEKEGRNFGSQYKAIQAAYDLARQLDFEFVGVQDADIAPERADYYETILAKFHENPRLGVVGGYIYERTTGNWKCRKSNSRDSVAGGVQMFRRACFNQIGGYKPLRLGGSDWLAQIEARRAGWEVVALPELPVYHYRTTSSAGGRLRGLFRLGLMDASFGSHPAFELLKCGRRLVEKPVVLGSIIRLSGYLSWTLSGKPPLIPKEVVAALRQAQSQKIKGIIQSLKS